MQPIRAEVVRYIKLGEGGAWERASLDRGELHFSHRRVPHELALSADREAIKRHLIGLGRNPRAAADDAREVIDFYTLGPDCLWIAFARDHLWWTYAALEVFWVGEEAAGSGPRLRKTMGGGWRSTDIHGAPLKMSSLSTKLTKAAGYRRTICAVEDQDYLIRRINGVLEPIVVEANQAREALITITAKAIASLHWADFETLVDIVFARSGWHRASAVGGSQKMIDLALEHPTTGERVAVQVKSRADQRVLEEYVSRYDEMGTFARLFFVCHSPRGPLSSNERRDIHVWAGRELAAAVVRAGLHDWVIEKVA